MPSLPLQNFVQDASTATAWLGAFWAKIYQDPDFMRQYQSGRVLLLTQMYLNVLEVAGLLDRKAAPVLHRERWYPLIIRRSQRGTGDAAKLRLGMTPEPILGLQTDTETFPTNTTFKLGGSTEFKRVNTYALNTGPVRVNTCIVDNIPAPNTVLSRDVDFVVENGTLIIRTESDPFDSGLFPTADVVGPDGTIEQEVVLWACDVMFDREYVYDHIGYVLGIKTKSTDRAKRLLNGTWDLVTSGPTRGRFQALLGALYDVPTVLGETETVEQIYDEPEGTMVITDKQVYRLTAEAVLREKVVVGAVLVRDEFLDQTIKIFFTIPDSDANKLREHEYGAYLREWIPAIALGPGFFRSTLKFGLTISWTGVPIYCAGLDENGNPKLWFPLVGDPEDVQTYWAAVWAAYEQAQVSMESCFTGYLDGIVTFSSGQICGYVSPLEFFLKQFIGANSVFVSVDLGAVPTEVKQGFATSAAVLMRTALPANVHLFVVERQAVASESYLLEEAGESIDRYAAKNFSSEAHVGARTPRYLTYKDTPPVRRWVPSCG